MIQIVEREMAPATEVSQRRNSGMGMVDESTPLTDFVASTLHEITVKKKKSYVARLLKENIESIKCVQELTTVRHKVSPGANIIRTLTLLLHLEIQIELKAIGISIGHAKRLLKRAQQIEEKNGTTM